jgi:peptidylprolyl isomerase
MIRRVLLLLALGVALVAAGCGGDDGGDGGSVSGTEATATASPAATQAPAAPDLTDTSTKPVIEAPSGDPPAQLVKEDIVKGKGKRAKKGDTVSVQYVGASWSNGQEFDASWDRGEPFSFQLGGGQVIQGWDQGLVGMRVGGRRKLVIPPDLGYGPAGSPPAIGPNETLVFIVDLQQIG